MKRSASATLLRHALAAMLALIPALAVQAGAGAPAAGATAAGATALAGSCPSGLVALTFDDGPSSALTPDFLAVLDRQDVPATFFVVGSRVRSDPAIVRRASGLGFTIGNQTYRHENLVRLSDAEIRATLRRTRQAIAAAGAASSPLMRPPYGSIDARVRSVVADLGLVPVLWTADPRDWDGRSPRSIVAGTLAQLNPGEPNIVLLHDGVDNSADTLLALPRIIRETRSRGYCFARLDRNGRPSPVVPDVGVADAAVTESPGGAEAAVTVTLDRPTIRATSVRVRTAPGDATSGRDYLPLDRRVTFPAGTTRRSVDVEVRDDRRDEPTERLRVLLSAPRGLRIVDRSGVLVIRDDDPPPTLRVRDAQVIEPSSGTVEVPVTLRLSRPSEKQVRVTVATEEGTADADDFVPTSRRVSFTPGTVVVRFEVTVGADSSDEPPETFTVRSRDGRNVVAGAIGTVTILPPSG